MPDTDYRFLALGDSYTIGEGLEFFQNWPNQLAAAIRAGGFPLGDPTIIAKTGWTTGDLLAYIEEIDLPGRFDLVTLLIGVNNQYQGKVIEYYQEEFEILLEIAVDLARGEPGRVVVMSIPDWGVTPFARERDRAQISAEIDRFNSVNRDMSLAAGVRHIDITPLSRQMADATWLAPDNLHPSAKMYTAWVELLWPIVKDIWR